MNRRKFLKAMVAGVVAVAVPVTAVVVANAAPIVPVCNQKLTGLKWSSSLRFDSDFRMIREWTGHFEFSRHTDMMRDTQPCERMLTPKLEAGFKREIVQTSIGFNDRTMTVFIKDVEISTMRLPTENYKYQVPLGWIKNS